MAVGAVDHSTASAIQWIVSVIGVIGFVWMILTVRSTPIFAAAAGIICLGLAAASLVVPVTEHGGAYASTFDCTR
jgi:apolipoprotein N-acyltransferase